MRSRLVEGRVWHRRRRPRDHRLSYRIFMVLLDLDELEALDAGLRLFSMDRLNLLDHRARDHLSGRGGSLKMEVTQILAAEGFPAPHRVWTLCMPRVLGAVFNPLTLYLCQSPSGALDCALYEVNNTFGERHSYLVPMAGAGGAPPTSPKTFYVSPFNTLDMRYVFHLDVADALAGHGSVRVRVEVLDGEGPLITAAFTGGVTTLTDGHILRSFLRHPLLAGKVVGAIHWEALKIWLKGGVRLVQRPAPPARFVTALRSAPEDQTLT